MAYNPGILIGRITKTSGFEGAVILRPEKNLTENIQIDEPVFIEIDGRPVPFFISSIEEAGSDMKITFEGYDTIDKVNEFKDCRVFLTNPAEPVDQTSDSDLMRGFHVMDQEENPLGIVLDIIYNPGQMLLSIEDESGREILIPFHEDLIIRIDTLTKTLIMDIPEGLSGINK